MDSQERVSRKTIWIDLDNTPHVPFFTPIIKELERRGARVVLTTRKIHQLGDLADQNGLIYTRIGRHYGRNPLRKLLGLLWRSLQLLAFALRKAPDLAVSHGARSQVFLANILGIPTVMFTDYEYSKNPPFCRPRWEIYPSVIPADRMSGKNLLTYDGIKEDVYVPAFTPEPGLLDELGLSAHQLIVTVRPPATEANYHNPESEQIFYHLIAWVLLRDDARIILLPRNKRESAIFEREFANGLATRRIIIPPKTLNGLNMIFFSDLVVSGGGTINREAAALGVPAFSIFRGPLGAVDKHLEATGRLVIISSDKELELKVKLDKREPNASPLEGNRRVLPQVVEYIEHLADSAVRGPSRI